MPKNAEGPGGRFIKRGQNRLWSVFLPGPIPFAPLRTLPVRSSARLSHSIVASQLSIVMVMTLGQPGILNPSAFHKLLDPGCPHGPPLPGHLSPLTKDGHGRDA